MITEDGALTLCLFCEILHKVSLKADKINSAIQNVQKKVEEMQGVERQDKNESSVEAEKQSDVMCKVTELEVKIAEVESKIDDSELFKVVRKGAKAMACVTDSGVVTRNTFQVLEDEVSDEPSLILVGDSLIRHQDDEFCKKGPRRKHLCYPGKKIEDITERVDDLVANSSERTVFAYFVGTNNVKAGRSEDTVRKYKALIKKLQESRRQSVICGLIPRYDVDSLTLSRMIGINTRVQDLCKKEGVMYIDVWDHFNRDRSLYGKDGLHLSSVGKARLGRVLDEGIRNEIQRNKTTVQGSQRVVADGSQSEVISVTSGHRVERSNDETSTNDLNA